jgi:hypothetical protein
MACVLLQVVFFEPNTTSRFCIGRKSHLNVQRKGKKKL